MSLHCRGHLPQVPLAPEPGAPCDDAQDLGAAHAATGEPGGAGAREGGGMMSYHDYKYPIIPPLLSPFNREN